MDACRYCGGKLDCCNDSEIVCPRCGEANCWPGLDDLIESDLAHTDARPFAFAEWKICFVSNYISCLGHLSCKVYG